MKKSRLNIEKKSRLLSYSGILVPERLRFLKDRGFNDDIKNDLFPDVEGDNLKDSQLTQINSKLLDISDEERYRRGVLRGDNIDILKSRIEEDSKLFNEKLKKDVDFVIRDLKREDIPMLIENNLETFYTK